MVAPSALWLCNFTVVCRDDYNEIVIGNVASVKLRRQLPRAVGNTCHGGGLRISAWMATLPNFSKLSVRGMLSPTRVAFGMP